MSISTFKGSPACGRGDDGAVREDSAAVTENSIARKSTAAIGNVFSFVVATTARFIVGAD